MRIALIAAVALTLATAVSRGRGKVLLRHDTFQQFRAGELEDGGANSYISARGAIQLVNRWDYNNDGNIDLLFVGNHDHSENLDAWLYSNSESGFSGKHRTTIPANGGRWALIRDLNGDGIPEIVIANTDNGTIGDLDSFVNWGSSRGYSTQNRTELPTIFSGAPAAADLNRDGYIDLIFPNGGTVLLHPGDQVFHRGAFIYWGGKDGYRKDRMTELPTNNAVAALVADFAGDGWDDVVFANTAIAEDSGRFLAGESEDRAGERVVAQSYIYWGGASTASHRIGVPR
jgi:FG-GAP-like repeat